MINFQEQTYFQPEGIADINGDESTNDFEQNDALRSVEISQKVRRIIYEDYNEMFFEESWDW